MKKFSLVLLMLASTNLYAFYEDPHEQFDMTHNISNSVKITFRQAADVTKACSAESIKRGYGPFPPVDACSFFNAQHSECLIITPRTANFHTIGHEVRHCLQGEFHAGK